MSKNSLRTLSEKVINYALEKKVDGCDIIAAEGKAFSLSAQNGDIDKYKVSSSNVLGLRIIKDKRVGISYSESMEEDSALQMVDQAIEGSLFSGVDEYQTISYKSEKDYVESNPDLYQEDNTPVEQKIDLTLMLESKVLGGDKRAKSSPYNGYSDNESFSIYMNHLGTYCSQLDKSFSCLTSVLAEEDGRQAIFAEFANARLFSELDADKCVNESLKYAIPLLKGKSVQTGKYDIIFSTDQWDQLFNCFMSSFSAKAAKEGKSRFKEKLNEKVADSIITITDVPKYAQGFSYSAFDDEGLPRQDLTLIEKGVLKNFYHNTATAHYFQTKSTGHGARSPKGSLGVAGTQLVLQVGETSETDITSGDFIEVIGLQGLHSGTNAISGHFSLAIEGIYYKGGQVHQYVRDVTISGNFFQLLEGVVAVGDQLHANSSRTFFSPKIRFSNISAAG